MRLCLSDIYSYQGQGTAVYDALDCLLMYYFNNSGGRAGFDEEGRAAYSNALQSLQRCISITTMQSMQDVLFATSVLSVYEVSANFRNVEYH